MSHLEQTLARISSIERGVTERVRARLDSLTKPKGSLGRLEELVNQVAAITGKESPKILRKVIVVMAADSGVAAESVSAYPQEVTAQMVCNIMSGGAAINVLSRHIGARLVVVDMGVACEITPVFPDLLVRKIGKGTANIARGPAMSHQDALRAVETGIEIVEREAEKGIDIVGTGDMGIANTTPSSAIASVFTGAPVEAVTGRGTGIDDKRLVHKIRVIEKALEVNSPRPDDPLGVLAKVGGFEIGGLTGVILGAASRRIPVVIDGFISGASALIAVALAPKVKEYLIAAHCSAEPGHKIVLSHLGLKPLLSLDMRLGEGTGAALGISLIEAATKIYSEMATFTQARVSGKID
jgi:nicotinate-nucleotide--dimethylbenzimidazole phosphoribosyltransferase